jgi:hypothetical protein
MYFQYQVREDVHGKTELMARPRYGWATVDNYHSETRHITYNTNGRRREKAFGRYAAAWLYTIQAWHADASHTENGNICKM